MKSLAFLLAALSAAVQADPLPMQLPDDVKPVRYAVELKVDPDQPRFSGRVRIELQLQKAQKELRLHARGLKLSGVLAQGKLRGRVSEADEDSVWLRFDQNLPAGKVQLELSFVGGTADADAFGLFRLRDDGHWYAITQFEDVGARRAIPSFDQPGFKTPWTLTLVVPEGQQAFANMPLAEHQPRRAAERGWRRLRFQTTPPLPSYLLAFAVGPFDVLQGPSAGPTTLRYLTAQGRAKEATYPAAATPAIVQALEAYFGLPHPFPKIDSLSLPMADGFGAMENVGLITYQRSWLQAPAPSLRFEQDYVSVGAHEIAHQWFGNAVTLAWWNDLWLNESFASWIGDKITAQLHPEWHWELASLADARHRAMHADALPDARSVRQPVQTPEDLGTAFNAITYQKGEAVLAMFEDWLGADAMRDGVRRYLSRHLGGTARAEDFFAALSEEGQPEAGRAMASFVAQPGIPQLDVQLDCEVSDKPRVELHQRRYQPLGASMAAEHWLLPLSLRTPAGVTRVLLREAEMKVDLPDAGCPAWLQPNAGGMGYYRSTLQGPAVQALLRGSEPTAQELLSLFDDQLALARSGERPLAGVLPMLDQLAARPELALREAAMQGLAALRPLLAADQSADYARQWSRLFGLQARALGWQPRAGEDGDMQAWRISLLPALADAGQDTDLRLQARALAERWLSAARADGAAHPELLDPALRAAVLRSAALSGDSALFDGLLDLARRTPEPALREDVLAALMAFEAPELAARGRRLLLDEGLDSHAMAFPVQANAGLPGHWQGLLDFFGEHEAALRPRIGEQGLAGWPERLSLQACSKEAADALQRAFGGFAASVNGGSAQLAPAITRLRLCGAYREAQRASLAAWLRS